MRLACRQPFDGSTVLDDVAATWTAAPRSTRQMDALILRLNIHLMRLVNIAFTTDTDQADETTARLIARVRSTHSQDKPREHQQVLGHLRRTAWTVNELPQRLVEPCCLRKVAD